MEVDTGDVEAVLGGDGMTLRGSAAMRTICEVLREANDLCQFDTKRFRKLRALLAEAEQMGKKMARKLYENNKEFDKDWWEKNPDYKKDLERRLDETYLSG